MDSFYDAPRKEPQMPPRNLLHSAPVVPEVSVLCTSNGPQRAPNNFAAYDQWKHSQNPYHHWPTTNKENINGAAHGPFLNQQHTSYFKKQVRFESPVLQQKPSLTYEPILPKNNLNNESNKLVDPQLLRFEKMYLGNLPDRQLDVSVIDLKPQKIKENVQKIIKDKPEENCPKTYKEFKEKQKVEYKKPETDKIIINDSVTDILNYKRSADTPVKYLGHFNSKLGDPATRKILDFSKTPTINAPVFEEVSKTPTINAPLLGEVSKTPTENNFKTHEQPNWALSNQYFPKSNENNSPRLHFDYSKTPSNNNLTLEERINENMGMKTDGNFTNNLEFARKSNFAIQETEKHFQPNFERSNFDTKDEQSPNFEKDSHEKPHSCPCKCQNESDKALVVKKDDEPSVRDLLKIISQQSEQIANLQKQVTALVAREVPHSEEHLNNSRYIMGTQTEAYRFTNVQETPKKSNKHRGTQGFSIDFTTSVSFRGNFQNKNQPFPKKNPENFGPKIQEIAESSVNSEQDRTLGNTSMIFDKPIEVRETCPSPQPSIKIDEMKDYEDSDEETSDSDSSEIGPSFYKNLMAQVNNVLQKAQIQPSDQMPQNGQIFGGQITNKTIHKVKEATVKHLRSIGVSVPDFNETTDSSCSSDDNKSYNQSDISFAVKQLLMKYLPSEHLAKVAPKEAQNLALIPKENIGAIKARPDFSFATVEYMKKYNLIAQQSQDVPRQNDIRQAPPPKTAKSNKILDISKLKQQPKLI